MRRNLLTFAVAGAIALSGFAIVQAADRGEGGPKRWHHKGGHLEKLTESLNLTPEQKAKVQPIIDQAKPQLKAIHQEARQKAKAVMDNTMTQIRPMLTAAQQKKFDDMRKAHEDMRDASRRLREARGE